MRARLGAIVAAVLLLALLPSSAGAAGAASTYHGTWQSATFDCAEGVPLPQEMDLLGNWNVTVRPNGDGVVHISMFGVDQGFVFRIDSWGGRAYGADFWSTSGGGSVVTLTRTDPLDPGATDTFVVDTAAQTVTFTIAPYFLGACASATSYGTVDVMTPGH